MLIGGISAISLLVSLAVCLGTGAFGGGSWIWLLPVTFAGSFLALTLAAFLFLMYLCKRVDQSVPQEEDDKLYRVVTDLVIQAALPVLRIRTKVTGMEKMPKEGRFLLVSNHCDNSDPILLLRAFAKYQLAFVSKQENSDMFVIGPMMHKIQCQLINRENDREALKTILNCIRILKEDKASVGVFPEGGILSEDGKLHRFRPGVFKIAQKAGVPIVVCTLHNTKEVVKNIKRFRGTKTELHVLKVIPAEELKGVSTIDIARRVHKLMADDLGPDLIAEE